MSPFLGTRGAGSSKAFDPGAGRPNQVTGLSATDFGTNRSYNDGRIDLSWTAPANNGAIISGYKIERSTDGSTYSALVANTASSSTTYTDTSLSSAQIYYYKVSAINSVGTGLSSTAANATATTVPQAPTIGTATAGNASATVTYTANATGGKAVSTYTATSSPGSLTGTGSSPITVSGLSNGTAYTFTITATNANGTSTASAASNSVTPISPPGTSWSSVSTTVGNTGAAYSTPTIYSMTQNSNGWSVAGATSNGYDMMAWGSGTSTNPPTSWTYTMGPYTNGGVGYVTKANGFALRGINGGSNYYYTTNPGQNYTGWSTATNIITFPGWGQYIRWDGSQYVSAQIYNGSTPYMITWPNHTTAGTSNSISLSLPTGANWGIAFYFKNYYYFATDNGTTTNYLYYRNGVGNTGWSFINTPNSYEYKKASTTCAIRMRNGQTSYSYTTDGVNWSTGTFPTTASYLLSTRADESEYVFAYATNGTIYYTTNGATWTATNLPSSYAGNQFVYNGSMWVVSPGQLQNSSGVAQPFYKSTN